MVDGTGRTIGGIPNVAAAVFRPVTCQNCRWLHLRPAVIACGLLLSFLIAALSDSSCCCRLHVQLATWTFGIWANRLGFFMLKKWFPCLPSTQQRTTFTLSAIQNPTAPCKSERENWISSVLDGWRSIPRRCVSFAGIFRNMAGKTQPLCFLTTRGVHIVDTNLPLVHWSKHANSKWKGVENLLLAYHNFAIYFQNKECQHYTTPYGNPTVCFTFFSTCIYKEPTWCNLAVCLLLTAIILYMFRTLFASIFRST
jgi:hypothetical protein